MLLEQAFLITGVQTVLSNVLWRRWLLEKIQPKLHFAFHPRLTETIQNQNFDVDE